MNPFSEQYKLLNNVELHRILEKSEKYQPLALEAAQLELAYRKLSNEDIDAARIELELENERENVASQREIGNRILKLFSPVWKYFTSAQAFLSRYIKLSTLSQWMIGMGAFISLVAYGFLIGYPMYAIGVILYWTTKEHIIDKITWTVLPVILFLVIITQVYGWK